MRVNASGVFLCAREAVRLMLAQEPHGGVIINMSSAAALIGVERRLPYSASKGAVLSMTRSIAIDFVDQGIRCNALCPGAITTRHSPPDGSEHHQRQISKTFLGRTGLPREIATVAAFLASDDASYITGAAIPVDGGWTSM